MNLIRTNVRKFILKRSIGECIISLNLFIPLHSMESTRQKKVARLLQKELGDIFLRESTALFSKAFISVTVVRVSADLSFAKVYLNIFGKDNKEEIFNKVKSVSKEIRKKVGDNIKQQVRIIPEFAYYIDDSIDYAHKIDELLKK